MVNEPIVRAAGVGALADPCRTSLPIKGRGRARRRTTRGSKRVRAYAASLTPSTSIGSITGAPESSFGAWLMSAVAIGPARCACRAA
jgi:hypothetical protein